MENVILNVNRCTFSGKIATELKLADVANTKVLNFLLAVTRRFKSKTTNKMVKEVAFIDMEAWSSGAEKIYNDFRKGDPIWIEASVKTDRWEDADGNKRKKTKFRVDHFEPIVRFDNDNQLEEEELPENAA